MDTQITFYVDIKIKYIIANKRTEIPSYNGTIKETKLVDSAWQNTILFTCGKERKIW